MYMTLQHQKKSPKLSDGRTVDTGEDGRPYADDGLLIVADGLGGRGGYPHTKINPDILDREKFYDIVFSEKEFSTADEKFKEFVLDSFSELFELKDIYFTDPDPRAKRTSGYFASRLVTAITLYELKFYDPDARSELFKEYREAQDDSQRAEILRDFGNGFAKRLQQQLECCAERMGLELESKTTGSYLLPSTLAVSFVDEQEDGADVLCLWAGDSRGYLWNADGLAQITDDHERDETMFNLITLTKPFEIEVRMLHIEKPALLFNASDGCYKCQCFASPFDLECLFLQALEASDSFEQTSTILDGQFAQIGTHDDSNTIALMAIGYEDFEAVKQDVNKRKERINEQYISRLEGILERDYLDERNRAEAALQDAVFGLKEKLFDLDEVCEFVKEKMKVSRFAPFMEALRNIDEQLANLDEGDRQAAEAVRKCVSRYWIRGVCFRKYAIRKKFFEDNPYITAAGCERKIEEQRRRYEQTIDEVVKDFESCAEAVRERKEQLLKIEEVCKGTAREELRPYLERLESAISAIIDAANGKFTKDYRDESKRLLALEERYRGDDEATIRELTDRLIRGELSLDAIDFPEQYSFLQKDLRGAIEQIRKNAETRRELQEDKEGLPDQFFKPYCEANAKSIVADIWTNHRGFIPRQLLEEMPETQQLLEQIKQLEKDIRTREEIYEEYEESYKRNFEESKLK